MKIQRFGIESESNCEKMYIKKLTQPFPSFKRQVKILHVDSCQPNSDLLPPQTLNSVHLLVMSNGIHDGLPDLWPL